MNKYHIKLTIRETVLVKELNFHFSQASDKDARAAHKTNGLLIPTLFRSLSERCAIPRKRLTYWNDPEYNTSRLKTSHKGAFERNGCKGQQIYAHPHFLPYLRYFLFGADLPEAAIAKFEDKVGNPDWVTLRDDIRIAKYARDITRQHCLDKYFAAEEFFKLCLDMRLGLFLAKSVRTSLRRMK